MGQQLQTSRTYVSFLAFVAFWQWWAVLFGVGGSPKISGRWAQPPCDKGVHAPLKHATVPHGYQKKFRRSIRLDVITEIHRIILTPCVPPFKVTQGHWNRHWLIGCLWLHFSVPLWTPPLNPPLRAYLVLFRDKLRFLSKIANFSNHWGI